MNSQSEVFFESPLSGFAYAMAETLFDSQAKNISREDWRLLPTGIIKRLPAEISLLYGGIIVRTIVLQQCAFDVSQFSPEDVAISASMGVAAAFGVSRFCRYFSEDEVSNRFFDYMAGKMPDAPDNERFAHLFSRFVVGKEAFWWLMASPLKQKGSLLILGKMASTIYQNVSALVIEKSKEFIITEADTASD